MTGLWGKSLLSVEEMRLLLKGKQLPPDQGRNPQEVWERRTEEGRRRWLQNQRDFYAFKRSRPG